MNKLIWCLPLSLCSLIIWLSHHASLPGGMALPHPLDKLAHFSAYALLACLFELAFRHDTHRRPMYRRHWTIFILIALFGATDEIHQAFIPGRECSFWDWLADVAGGATGLALSCLPLLWGRKLGAQSWWCGENRRPDPSRPLVILADTHWCEDLSQLYEWDQANPEADWLFLGDVFETWIGLKKLETPAQKEFLRWVDAQRNKGKWIGLWLGNREFFLDTHTEVFSMMGEGVGGALPEEGLHFEHGNFIQEGDKAYRVWNIVMNSGFVWILARMLPVFLARNLTGLLQKNVSSHRRVYASAFPEEGFLRAAAGKRFFVVGHFHVFREYPDGVSLPFAQDGRFLVWHKGCWNIYFKSSTLEEGASS